MAVGSTEHDLKLFMNKIFKKKNKFFDNLQGEKVYIGPSSHTSISLTCKH